MNDATVRVYESELSLIVHETSEYRKIETGGSLFGLWTNGGNPTVLLATRPGPQATRTATQFEQDVALHQLLEEVTVRHHGVQSVGLWHSHHGLGLHDLSGGDVGRTMRFARHAQRRLFCDLLCYFTGGRGAREPSEVTIKPYVYRDAAAGHRLPTSLAVLPGQSPLRAALLEQGYRRDVEEQLRFALSPVPGKWRGNWRTERSIELATNAGEDHEVPSGRGFWRPHKKKPEVHDADEAPASPAEPEWEVRHAIPNLEDYIHKYLEPALRDTPQGGITCELEPILNGRALRLTLTSADRRAARELDLGWDGRRPVVTRYVARIAQQPGPKDLLPEGEVRPLPEMLRHSFGRL